jgi:hypothetical protein
MWCHFNQPQKAKIIFETTLLCKKIKKKHTVPLTPLAEPLEFGVQTHSGVIFVQRCN